MSIILDNVNYTYSAGTAYEIKALKNINLKIEDGQFIGIIGHTGSREINADPAPERSDEGNFRNDLL